MLGFVLRLSEANGYPSSYLLGELGEREDPSRMGRLSATGLIELAGVSEAQARRLSMFGGRVSARAVKVLDQELMADDTRFSFPQVCPMCLSDEAVCHALWDLAFVSTCPVHAVALLSQCVDCGTPLRWSRLHVTHCRCGADLRLQRSTKLVSPAELILANVFRHKLLPDAHALPAEAAHLASLDLYALSRLVWVLAAVSADPWSQGKLVRSRKTLSSQLPAVAALLTNWPHGFQEFLNRTYGEPWRAAAEIPRFDRVFRWALDRLEANFGERRSQVRFVVEEIYRFGAQHWCRKKLGAALGYEHVLPSSFRWGTMLEGAQITGLQMGTLRKRINAGEVPVRRTLESKQSRNVMVDLDWARARKRASQSLGLRKAAKYVGLPIETLRALREREDIYRTDHQPHFQACYAVEDLDELKRRIVGNAPRVKAVPKDSSLLETILADGRRWSTAHKVEVVSALVEGRLVATGSMGDGPLRLTVPTSELEALWRAVTGPQVAAVTFAQAAASTGTIYEKVRGLVQHKHLHTTPVLGRPQITVASLEAFQRRYTLLSGMAGWRTRTVADLAERRKIKLEVLQLPRGQCWLVPKASLAEIRSLCRSGS
jgi:hypothetical protein